MISLPLKLSDYHYDLPDHLIARSPLAERSQSRLLTLHGNALEHRQFSSIIDLLRPNDLLICNNTKVMPARLLGKKETGGQVEVLVERILNEDKILALVSASKPPKIESILSFLAPDKTILFKVLARTGSVYTLQSLSGAVLSILNTIGTVPVPHYFKRAAEENDKQRYQTVYAKHLGSVAAPTAGLHFDEALIKKIEALGTSVRYLTLHIGAGTFTPVRTSDITQHIMHAEHIEVSAELCDHIKQTKSQGGRIIAVGTTTVRSLETASLSGEIRPYRGDTQIFIYPGFKFNCVDALITNFHLPGSSLLMLVCALGGHKEVMAAYQTAVMEQYRFFSYGDAMWTSRN